MYFTSHLFYADLIGSLINWFKTYWSWIKFDQVGNFNEKQSYWL